MAFQSESDLRSVCSGAISNCVPGLVDRTARIKCLVLGHLNNSAGFFWCVVNVQCCSGCGNAGINMTPRTYFNCYAILRFELKCIIKNIW